MTDEPHGLVPPGGSLQDRLRAATTARVAIGRIGSAIPTAALLDFQLAHARARDAVHAPLGDGVFATHLSGRPVIQVSSRAVDRNTYLMRPDLGRMLDPKACAQLAGAGAQLIIVIADGLSATAVKAHGADLAAAIIKRAGAWRIGPIVVAHQARVALADEVGELLGADIVVMLIGERPGLSAADSMSAYITWQPRKGRLDSERHCISNIRPPHGWGIAAAADEVMRVVMLARHLGCTGVAMITADPEGDHAIIEG